MFHTVHTITHSIYLTTSDINFKFVLKLDRYTHNRNTRVSLHCQRNVS